MKYLPYENLTYKTHLSKEEILKRLNNKTEPEQWIRMSGVFSSGKHKEYEGVINENSFKISRIIGYRNSFLPRIEGKIEEGKGSTLIHIKMRLHTFVLVFLVIWLSVMFIAATFLITTFSREVSHQSISSLASFTPFLMIIIISIVTILAFHYEGNKSKEFFQNLFEAERQANQG
ncbi:hypothetical protein V9L05_03175 [Bernardetia sp. Wsw4-3y2]|uniref:hypothetical protein n=1 Tax=Bernardetia sp. Wsw4-3y2 TaxID=3127471 RepID=UPI0030D0BC4B